MEFENNIYFSQIKAVTTAGVMFPEFKNAPDWLTYASQQINSQLDLQFRPDGVHNDLDPSYHRGTLDNFYTTYNLVQANERSDVFPSDLLTKLRNACWFMIDVTYPDYLLEYFNDTRKTTKNVMKRNFRHYSEMFPEDQEILWMATEGERGTMPTKKMALYSDGGYYMLRNGYVDEAGYQAILSGSLGVHPTFFYESAWNFVGLLMVYFMGRKRKFDGQCFLFYVFWYGLGRAWIEGLRTDSLYLYVGSTIRVSQLVAALSALVAGIVLLVMLLRKNNRPENLYVNKLAAQAAQTASKPAQAAPEAGEPEREEASEGPEADGEDETHKEE